MKNKILFTFLLFFIFINIFVIFIYAFTVDNLPLSLETSTGKVYDILSYPNPPSSFSYTDVMLMANDNNFFLCFFDKDDIYYHSETYGNLFLSFSGNKSICYYQVNVSYYKQPYKSDYFYFNGYTRSINIGKSEFSFFSSCDILGDDGTVAIKKSVDVPQFNISLSTAETTKPPITAYSNYFSLEDFEKYKCYISEDGTNWNSMYYDTLNDTINNVTKFRFYYHITKNGAYYFKLVNQETGKEEYMTHNITNIIYDETNTFSSNGIPIPFCTYERVNGQFIISTQNFPSDDFKKYKCFYIDSKDYANNKEYSTWKQMGIGTVNNKQLGQTEFNFFFTVPADSEDTSYFMVFYDCEKQEFGDPATLNCFFDKMNEYADKVDGVEKEKKNKLDELINFFNGRFGFLTYPFEFIATLFDKILHIEYTEPIIHIPEVYIPTTNQKIFNGLDYNFNTLLENSSISNIYNIYLMVVDFIIVLGLIVFAKNTLMEVFGNG